METLVVVARLERNHHSSLLCVCRKVDQTTSGRVRWRNTDSSSCERTELSSSRRRRSTTWKASSEYGIGVVGEDDHILKEARLQVRGRIDHEIPSEVMSWSCLRRVVGLQVARECEGLFIFHRECITLSTPCNDRSLFHC